MVQKYQTFDMESLILTLNHSELYNYSKLSARVNGMKNHHI